jgi:hypothetical protein
MWYDDVANTHYLFLGYGGIPNVPPLLFYEKSNIINVNGF